jgi:hypothetical protein
MTNNQNTYSQFLLLGDESAYRQLYVDEYCNKEIKTHEGIRVMFPRHQFDHAFFKSSSRRAQDKSIFCMERAKRILWIKKALLDPALGLYAGWDSKRKVYDQSRRVCLVTPDSYAIVLRITGNLRSSFVTAYLIDDPSVETKIKSSPVWVG